MLKPSVPKILNQVYTEEIQKDEGDQSNKEEMDEEESECMHVY